MPIIERAQELRALRDGFGRVGHPGAQVLAVTGPPGIGKTALLSAFTAECEGWLVLSASGTTLGSRLPHGVLLQWFARLARTVSLEAWPFDGPGALLRELLVKGVAPADSASLSYALQWVVARLAERQRVLLVVDDLQWADPSSLAIIGNAIGLLSAEPVGMLFGIRDASAEHRDPIVSAILEAATIVAPAHLTVDGVSALVGDSGFDAARIHSLSGGVPFYVTELVSMATAGQELTSSVRVVESVGGRLDRLGAAHKGVARAIAILGTDAGRLAVTELSGVGGTRLAGIARDLLSEGILADSDRLAVSHPLVGEAILHGVGSAALAELYDRAARVLSALGVNGNTVAVYVLNSPVGHDPWRVAILAGAGRGALRAGSGPEAARFLGRAIQELREDDPARADLLIDAGTASIASNDGAMAAKLWSEGLAFITDIGRRVRVLADIGDALFACGDYVAAEAAYDQGTRELTAARIETTRPVFREFVARTLSAQLSLTIAPSAFSQEVVAQTIEQPDELDTAEDSMLLAAATVALSLAGDAGDRGRDLARRAYRSWPRSRAGLADDPTTYLLSGALNYAGLFPEGVELLTDAVNEAQRSGRILSEATARYCRGSMHLSAGDVRRAVRDLVAAVNAVRFGWSHYREGAEALLIRCHLALGDGAAAAAIALAADYPSASALFQSVQVAGKADYWTGVGRPDRGLALAYRAGELMPAGIESTGMGWRGSAGDALLALGDVVGAQDLAREEFALAEATGSQPASLGPALYRLARTVSDPDEAIETGRRALAVVGPSRRLLHAQVTELLADRLIETGQREESVPLLTGALEYFHSQGVASAEKRVRARLAAIGHPVVPSSAAQRVSSLSPAEYRVAALATQGLTNREIAGSLFVTMKTVEFHLSRCYRKLAVTTRHELTELFQTAGNTLG